ncbi:hypothetical protein ACWC09_11855 [Streptomyces sp. NPDC001617]
MNSWIPRPHRPSWHTLAAVLAMLAIIAAGATATFTTASGHGTSTVVRTVADDESSRASTPATITTTGVELTTDQVQALQSAAGGNPNLTADQAEAAASVPDGFGSGSASGICGTAILQGWDNGSWSFSLNFNAVVGAAAMGAVTVSTDGQFGASSKQFGVSGTSVYHDASRDGDLDSVGWGATATTLNGWALTNGAWLCVVSVTAPWNYS